MFCSAFNAAFAHRAAVDNKHPSVFVISELQKSSSKSLPSENKPWRAFCSTWMEVSLLFWISQRNSRRFGCAEINEVFALLCGHVCSILKLSKCSTSVTNNDLLLTHLPVVYSELHRMQIDRHSIQQTGETLNELANQQKKNSLRKSPVECVFLFLFLTPTPFAPIVGIIASCSLTAKGSL